MVSFGDSKHEPVKPLHRLLDVTPLKFALSAKCTIHDVVGWPYLYFIILSKIEWFVYHCQPPEYRVYGDRVTDVLLKYM